MEREGGEGGEGVRGVSMDRCIGGSVDRENSTKRERGKKGGERGDG